MGQLGVSPSWLCAEHFALLPGLVSDTRQNVDPESTTVANLPLQLCLPGRHYNGSTSKSNFLIFNKYFFPAKMDSENSVNKENKHKLLAKEYWPKLSTKKYKNNELSERTKLICRNHNANIVSIYLIFGQNFFANYSYFYYFLIFHSQNFRSRFLSRLLSYFV
jgi:hypothetical protein